MVRIKTSPFHWLTLSFILCISIACTEEIDLTLPPSSEELVFDATLTGISQRISITQHITLSRTAGINETPAAETGAIINVSQGDKTFSFSEDLKISGSYVNDHIKLTPNATYTLNATTADGSEYQASYTALPPVTIDHVDVNGVLEDFVSLSVFIQDIPNERNFYETTYFSSNPASQVSHALTQDELLDGEVLVEEIIIDSLFIGDTITFILSQIDYPHYLFLGAVESQSYQGSPFSPPASGINGNIINLTDNTQRPLGYFRVLISNFYSFVYNGPDVPLTDLQ